MAITVEVYAVDSEYRTGAFLGFGSLLDPALVFLHTEAATPAPTKLRERRRPVRSGRARCRIKTDEALFTLDGAFLPAPTGLTVPAPVVVQLDLGYAGDIDELQLPSGPGHPTAEETAEAVNAYIAAAAADDPKAPATPPPTGPDVVTPVFNRGKRPWYCMICPGAWGC